MGTPLDYAKPGTPSTANVGLFLTTPVKRSLTPALVESAERLTIGPRRLSREGVVVRLGVSVVCAIGCVVAAWFVTGFRLDRGAAILAVFSLPVVAVFAGAELTSWRRSVRAFDWLIFYRATQTIDVPLFGEPFAASSVVAVELVDDNVHIHGEVRLVAADQTRVPIVRADLSALRPIASRLARCLNVRFDEVSMRPDSRAIIHQTLLGGKRVRLFAPT